MTCKHFGECASCSLYNSTYEDQLQLKVNQIRHLFNLNKIDIIKSPDSNFRYRCEFRTYFEKDHISYAMSNFDNKKFKIDSCSIVSNKIVSMMKSLLEVIQNSELLKKRLFTVEFLSTTTNKILITLIYHKKIDELWREEAYKLSKKLGVNIIGRSRKIKIVVDRDYIDETLHIDRQEYIYRLFDGCFTQPNTAVNIEMIEWILKNINQQKGDLLELYCGLGNFTLPLATRFNKVLATEVSKRSIQAALKNKELNGITNIEFVRLSSQELVEALNKVREFRRLGDISIDSYDFSCIFVDPPRAGLDNDTLEFLREFPNIIYISCNPQTLKRDLNLLQEFQVERFAIFDQFAYTNHIECGVILTKL